MTRSAAASSTSPQPNCHCCSVLVRASGSFGAQRGVLHERCVRVERRVDRQHCRQFLEVDANEPRSGVRGILGLCDDDRDRLA